MRVLTVNAGSSSLKLTLLDRDDAVLAAEELPVRGERIDEADLRRALDAGLGQADAIGHRIVHGGERFREAVRIDAAVEAALRELTDLAPLHQPKSLAALDAVTAVLDLPAVACFDTAFHATLPATAATYALPAQWRERWGLRRYGFHGLSHAWIARRVPQVLAAARPEGSTDTGAESPRPGESSRLRRVVRFRRLSRLRIVSCHLGAGASLCAISNGRSRDTTMGFTPLAGLVMATRSGSLDPGMLLWLAEREGLTPHELTDALEHRSGLLGLSGTSDMRELLARAAAGDSQAELALGVYLHSLRAHIAAMTASLGGLDVLAFTGGVGEGAPRIRELVVGGLGFLGVAIDPERNHGARAGAGGGASAGAGGGTSAGAGAGGSASGAGHGGGPGAGVHECVRDGVSMDVHDGGVGVGMHDDEGVHDGVGVRDVDISAPGAAVATLVIRAREDREIARQVRSALVGA